MTEWWDFPGIFGESRLLNNTKRRFNIFQTHG